MTGDGRPRLYLYDDAPVDRWHPFALTRPAAELRYGVLLLRERLERFAGVPCRGLLTRPWLADYREPWAPEVTTRERVGEEADRLFLASRFLPDPSASVRLPEEPAVLVADGHPVGRYAPAGSPAPASEWLRDPGLASGTVEVEVGGRLLGPVWEVVDGSPEQVARDVAAFAPSEARIGSPDELPRGVWAEGAAELYLEEEVRVEPGVFLDLREGPVWLGAGVEVGAGSRLAGPLYAGPGSRLLGGAFSRLAAGPMSYLRGEVESSTVLGHSNKAHEGFLGHAYLGRWVNLGAGTTNSDLKNNYGPVRLGTPGGEVETGLLKLGCLLGDHVKTAIGTLLPTGSSVGAGSNLFDEETPPRWVPPFSWGHGPGATRYRKEDFLRTAETVMQRRGVPFADGTRRWLAAVWEEAGKGTAG